MKGHFFGFPALFLALTIYSCHNEEEIFRFVPAHESRIDFVNRFVPNDSLNILTYLYFYNGGGVMVADFNNDNLKDIYFTSNQGRDKFYLNRGNFVFEDATGRSAIHNATGWTTGVTHVDINNDGLLDIYICKVGGHGGFVGKNLLFINQGCDTDGIPVFREDAKSYGLDVSTLSTQAAFFDYDLDGDLDMFLLTHSLHPNRSYGQGSNRLVNDSDFGDRLFENRDGYYFDVTVKAGIFKNKISYGLGIAIGDLNKDGFPDIYIGNDFFENDYCYRNNGNKTFTELISKDARIFGHTSHYSMGNSMADLNNDGFLDILSLDMLPKDLFTLKSSGVEDGYSIYQQYLRNGYAPQYMQNTLHLNKGNDMFSEVGFQAGIAATEWSWGVLAADFDLDGWKDIYITNGIRGATNDMDYISFVTQAAVQRDIEKRKKGYSKRFLKEMPQKKVANFAFRNTGGANFEDVSERWFSAQESFSNGCAYGDLDNDGDLDLIVNNVDQKAFLLENRINDRGEHSYLKIKLVGPPKNRFALGASVEVFIAGLSLFEEHFPVKGYLSSGPNELVLGLGGRSSVDSLKVTWPDGSFEVRYDVHPNQTITLDQQNATRNEKKIDVTVEGPLENVGSPIEFRHNEQPTLDFDRDPLVPFALSNEGPAISIGDFNGDGLDDMFVGGAKFQAGELFVQSSQGEFTSVGKDEFERDAICEDTDNMFFDADNDGDIDLIVVAGGNEFTSGEALEPRLYKNENGQIKRDTGAFRGVAINASVVKVIDVENDGDNDIIIGSNAQPGKFGETSSNYLFQNDGEGNFRNVTETLAPEFKRAGLINDMEVCDFDSNGFLDVVVVGDWMPVMLFFNDGKLLTPRPLPESNGWWNAVAIDDFDKDGDVDLVVGNWGLNSRLAASATKPILLYRADVDDNGSSETILVYNYLGAQTLLASRDELAKQAPQIKKRFLSYREFASAEISDILPNGKINDAILKEVNVLATSYFTNHGDNTFDRRELPWGGQISTTNDILIDDFNKDSFSDILLVGNNYELSTQLGRLDASHGVLMMNDQSGFFREATVQNFDIAGPARKTSNITINGREYIVVTINNDRPIFLEKL